AGVHHQQRLATVRARRAGQTLELIVGAIVVERPLAGPDPFDDAPPFGTLGVPTVVLQLVHAEHLELVVVPATDQVRADPPLPDVVGGGELLGGEQRVVERNGERAEDVYALSRRQQSAGPGDRLEARAVRVGLTAVALPAGNRDQALDPNLV